MWSFIPYEVLWSPQWSVMPCEFFLSHWVFVPPGVFYALWRFILLKFFFFYSTESLVPHGIFYSPCGSAASLAEFFKTFVYIWTLCATQGVLYPRDLFPFELSCDPNGSVVPLLFHQTQIVLSQFYVHTSRRYALDIRMFWGLSHQLNILQSVSTMWEKFHMRMFDITLPQGKERIL
jgi:hypothetical protein